MTRHEPDNDAVARYVAGTMPAAELDQFEPHLLGCEACRSAVRVGAAARAALVSQPAEASPLHDRRRPWYWLGAAAAAGVVLVVATRANSSVDPLGTVTPAPFVAGQLRPSSDAATALVDRAMLAYVASDFATAVELLRRAARTDSSTSVAFFLGVSLLMRGEAALALEALGRSAVDGPYAGDAAYYMAKALVRLNRPDSAIAVLERASATAPARDVLRAFADSIRGR